MVEKETVDQLLTDTPEAPQEDAPQEEVVQAQPQVDRSQQQKENFRRLKEEKEKAERERDELIRLLAMQQTHAKPQQQAQEDEDEIIDRKTARKMLREQEDRHATQLADLRIYNQYPDWDKVVSEENAARLKREHPQVFKALQESGDYYSKKAAAYTIIKKLDLDADEDVSGTLTDRQRIALNATKPKLAATLSPSAPSKGLTAAAADDNRLTPELAAKYYQEMLKSRKGYFA